MNPHFHTQCSRRGVALVLVLAMIVIMTGLIITVFVSVTGERRSAAVKVQGMSSSQLASSAPQLVISQIQSATTGGKPWASQPGMIRTYSNNSGSADRVYKLYSAKLMSDANFSDANSDSNDAPPADWNTGKNSALYCDINRPVTATSGTLVYPVADPSAANDAFDKNDANKIPGYQRKSSEIPGFDKSQSDSATNNPLPMPVRWIYVLKNGRMAVPSSIDANSGVVTFSADGALPSPANPVVGRLAFWSDDDTCKVNINTAGYAKNDGDYWSYWDTPYGQTAEEIKYLSWGQPWTNEFQRYPGHPASTGLNVVFDSLSSSAAGLTDNQILALCPRYNAGGSSGGTNIRTSAPSSAEIAALRKQDRLFASVDEMFYGTNNRDTQSAAAAGIEAKDLEARRFLLTASSRAPEVTLWNTPRVTIWPTFQNAAKRTAIDKLITFCSTIGQEANAQPFYFVRDSPLATNELTGMTQNYNLWTYLQTLSNLNTPGFGWTFGSKYGSTTRDQILTSIFDAIRLANLDDRTGPDGGIGTGYSFTAGDLMKSGASWVPKSSTFTGGYVAPTYGPKDETRSPGRTGTLAEVAIVFARKTPDDWDRRWCNDVANHPETAKDSNGWAPVDYVNAAFFYGFFTPTAGMVQPGQDRKIVVSGLNQFYVTDSAVQDTDPQTGEKTARKQMLFPNLPTYICTQIDKPDTSRRDFGGKLDWSLSMLDNPVMYPTANGANNHTLAYGPPTTTVLLPYYTYNAATKKGSEDLAKQFYFSGGTLNIKLYSPSTAEKPYQEFNVTFPEARPLSPMIVMNYMTSTDPIQGPENPTKRRPSPDDGWAYDQWDAYSGDGRFPLQEGAGRPAIYYDYRISFPGDTVLGVQNKTGAYAWEALRSGTINDFQSHTRYNNTANSSDLNGLTLPASTSISKLTRRATSMRWATSNGIANSLPCPALNGLMFGRLYNDFNDYTTLSLPVLVTSTTSLDKNKNYGSWDFSSGPGTAQDGSLLPKTDEGAELYIPNAQWNENPYFRNTNIANRDLAQATLNSPNRQMPSPIYFGMIPTGPWQTLLFRPARMYHPGGTTHPGANNPPDYLMLDWFHMPIVEPYAISEPFSTAGKINLNSQLMPFGNYLRRETGLHAVLRSARIPVVPESVVSGSAYSSSSGYSLTNLPPSANTRVPIDEEETLKMIRKRFDGTDNSNKRVYLTDAEICSVDLIPQGYSESSLSAFWDNKRPTGDNLRENAYSSILPRLTARSNTYTVHVTAEALQNTEADGGWREGKGVVTAEWRGSFGIERYIDPNDARFTAATSGTLPHNFLAGDSVEPFYKFRILGEKRFDP